MSWVCRVNEGSWGWSGTHGRHYQWEGKVLSLSRTNPFSLIHFLMCAPHIITMSYYWEGEEVLWKAFSSFFFSKKLFFISRNSTYMTKLLVWEHYKGYSHDRPIISSLRSTLEKVLSRSSRCRIQVYNGRIHTVPLDSPSLGHLCE